MPADFNLAPSVSVGGSSVLRLNDSVQQRSSPLAHMSSSSSSSNSHHMVGNTNGPGGNGNNGGGSVGVNGNSGTLGQLNLGVLTNTPNGAPSLDPNAKTYTPKNNSLVGSTEA